MLLANARNSFWNIFTVAANCYGLLKYSVAVCISSNLTWFEHVEWITIDEIVALRVTHYHQQNHVCKLSTGLIAGWLTAENQMKFVHFVCFVNYHANSSNSMKSLYAKYARCTLSLSLISFHSILFHSMIVHEIVVNFLKILQIFYYRSFWHYIYRACIIILLAVFDYIS